MYAAVIISGDKDSSPGTVLFNANDSRDDKRGIFDTFEQAEDCLFDFRSKFPNTLYGIVLAEDVCDVAVKVDYYPFDAIDNIDFGDENDYDCTPNCTICN